MPYTDSMDRFHQAHVDELVALTDLVAGRIAMPCSAQEAQEAQEAQAALRVAEACDLSRREGRPILLEAVGS